MQLINGRHIQRDRLLTMAGGILGGALLTIAVCGLLGLL
jgi:hypothetical protein